MNTVFCMDCLEGIKQLKDNLVDLMVSDPPYGLSFMGKDWDKAVPSVDIWKECLRVMKPGAFAFILCTPRQDCLSEMIRRLGEAGFKTGFTSIYWAYATGFPKAMNIGKAIDKKLGKEREVIGKRNPNLDGSIRKKKRMPQPNDWETVVNAGLVDVTVPSSEQAKHLDGCYAGFQPKPAVEVVLVVMKPLAEKTYVGQALANGKGVSWLDDCRIPYKSEDDYKATEWGNQIDFSKNKKSMMNISNWKNGFVSLRKDVKSSPSGRFPGNLLVSDNILDDGTNHKSGSMKGIINNTKSQQLSGLNPIPRECSSSEGGFSRFFDLDTWAKKNNVKTFPFLITPKASKGEKNLGCEGLPVGEPPDSARSKPAEGRKSALGSPRANSHPTCKPLKLINYLITLGSREGDTVLDPFTGSGTTGVAAYQSNRNFIGYEISEDYHRIAEARINHHIKQHKLNNE